ncbi:MAG: L-glyceraldehyde 3-phosphate reductase [Firmicutes bacterium]|nr:L-glyceraldehyde 3-phosphate reductase [Bacillota bacterium]
MGYLPAETRYEEMIYRRCGKSGLKLPLLSLGLWHNFGYEDAFANMRAMVWRAFDLGITHFDLANNYGPPPGAAEENFGRILKQDLKDHRDELVISTKAGYHMWPGPYGDWGSKKYLLASLDRSLRRLGLDYVDIFYSHRPDPATPLAETMEALAQAVRQGKALYVGISSYPPEQTRMAYEILKSMGITCLVHQPSYSLFDRWIEDGLLDLLDELGMGCVVFSPLAQGILTDKYLHGIPADSRAAKPTGFLRVEQITGEKIEKVKRLASIARQRGQTMAQFALSWVLRKDTITSAIIGASKPAQIEENVKSIKNLTFSPEELEEIERILRS